MATNATNATNRPNAQGEGAPVLGWLCDSARGACYAQRRLGSRSALKPFRRSTCCRCVTLSWFLRTAAKHRPRRRPRLRVLDRDRRPPSGMLAATIRVRVAAARSSNTAICNGTDLLSQQEAHELRQRIIPYLCPAPVLRSAPRPHAQGLRSLRPLL